MRFEDFKERMKKVYQQDQRLKSVQLSGETLEEILIRGAKQLHVPAETLHYEILEKKRRGLQLGKCEYTLLIYQEPASIASWPERLSKEALPHQGEGEQREESRLGSCSLKVTTKGVFLRVVGPGQGGIPVPWSAVLLRLKERSLTKINKSHVKKVWKEARGEWQRVGECRLIPQNNASATVSLSEDHMCATICVTPPGPGGVDLEPEAIRKLLKERAVSFGIDDKAIEEFTENPLYDEDVVVARGRPPVPGRDTHLVYGFETDVTKIDLKEGADGRIDFKELNLIRNVTKGQPLARKVSAEEGSPGYSLLGEKIEASPGKDCEIHLGNNVVFDESSKVVLSTEDGQALLVDGKVTVETITVIPGDVDISTGNVRSLGTVLVKGNVEDGFSISARGAIEIAGYVGKASLKAEGDIIVNRGINGGGLGEASAVVTQGSVWTAFINNAHVKARKYVMVSDGIVNSQVISAESILCKGKRGKIVGGRLQAVGEINAASLGARAGTPTFLEVGYDPFLREAREHALSELKKIDGRLKEISDILVEITHRDEDETDEKTQGFLERLEHERRELFTERVKVAEREKGQSSTLKGLLERSKVSASRTVWAGVQILVGEAMEEVRMPYSYPVTFIQENGLIVVRRYEEFDEKVEKKKGASFHVH